jgi:enoyl-CoA hydratase/carnithine racemase
MWRDAGFEARAFRGCPTCPSFFFSSSVSSAVSARSKTTAGSPSGTPWRSRSWARRSLSRVSRPIVNWIRYRSGASGATRDRFATGVTEVNLRTLAGASGSGRKAATCSSTSRMRSFLTRFASFYRDLFIFPKPVIAALNGHAIAGGCMIAIACDRAMMAEGSAKISLNEIGFGSSVFAGSVEILQFRTGPRAADVLYSGAMYSPVEAQRIGLIDEVVATALLDRACEIAAELGSRRPAAFASLKSLLRKPVADAMANREAASIREFVEIWYSEPTWTNLHSITIR